MFLKNTIESLRTLIQRKYDYPERIKKYEENITKLVEKIYPNASKKEKKFKVDASCTMYSLMYLIFECHFGFDRYTILEVWNPEKKEEERISLSATNP